PRWPFRVGTVVALVITRGLMTSLPRLGPGSAPVAPSHTDLALHAMTAASFFVVMLVARFAGAGDLVLVFILGLWLGAHAVIVGRAALRRLKPEKRWLHRAAGLGFGAWYLAYLALFLVYALDGSVLGYPLRAYLVPPALAI